MSHSVWRNSIVVFRLTTGLIRKPVWTGLDTWSQTGFSHCPVRTSLWRLANQQIGSSHHWVRPGIFQLARRFSCRFYGCAMRKNHSQRNLSPTKKNSDSLEGTGRQTLHRTAVFKDLILINLMQIWRLLISINWISINQRTAKEPKCIAVGLGWTFVSYFQVFQMSTISYMFGLQLWKLAVWLILTCSFSVMGFISLVDEIQFMLISSRHILHRVYCQT